MKRTYQNVVKSRIQGIPCLLGITRYESTPPWAGSILSCPSDLDYYGYTECEYDILDRKGYNAAWLEKKCTPKDEEQHNADIDSYFSRNADNFS